MSVVIRVENVSKQYRLGEVGTGSLAHDVNRWWHRIRGNEDPYLKVGEANDRSKKGDSDYSWALRDVSFEVKQGEVLGIIGRNGAGKSTLLKILSRVTRPTTGEIKVKGRIASLLEVGTGFHPELTGRENIFLNGAILGMRKEEIRRKFDEIVEFSGCERYIDTPVKRYSSGMYVRLAFAVAAHLEPEILIVDEVLAVGDAEFQKKCLGKMKDVAGQGRTVLFVSHNMVAVQNLCSRCIWMSNGLIAGMGPTRDIARRYLGDQTISNTYEQVQADIGSLPPDDVFEILDVCLAQGNNFPSSYGNDHPISVRCRYRIKERTVGARIFMDLLDNEGHLLIRTFNDENDDAMPVSEPGIYQVEAVIPANLLAPLSYEIRMHATVHNVRRCTGNGVGISLNVSATNGINRAYPNQPVFGKLRPYIAWLNQNSNEP